jgi:hypothetical protein
MHQASSDNFHASLLPRNLIEIASTSIIIVGGLPGDGARALGMAAILDGFMARKDGSVNWLETSDEFADGNTMDPHFAEACRMGMGMG